MATVSIMSELSSAPGLLVPSAHAIPWKQRRGIVINAADHARPDRHSDDTRSPHARARVAAIASRAAPWTGLTIVALALLGCSDQATDPATARMPSPSAANATKSFPTELATVGWQAQARALIASHVAVGPLIAVRAYALLGVAEYGAVVDAGKQLGDNGVLDGNGFGVGGRARFEAERGAVAGASAQLLSFLFPNAAAALEQRLSDEAKAGPGGVHPQFTRGVATGRAFGDVMIAWSKADGFSKPWTGTIPVGPGLWTSAPGVPQRVRSSPQ